MGVPSLSSDHGFDQRSLKGQRWVMKESTPWTFKLAQHLSLSPFVAKLLGERVDSLEDAEAFLAPSLKNHLPDPCVLPDLSLALERISHAIQTGELIGIWGDYDVDGATSSALWGRFLQALGCPVRTYIPDRFLEGYGPSVPGLTQLASEGVRLVIMLDCGTTAFGPLEAARDLGLEVVVIDHHMPEAKHPVCHALVNPKRLDSSQDMGPFLSLAAVGVSFCVLVALSRYLREQGLFSATRPEPNLIHFLDLVALGTVCDVMPLRGLNRLLVTKGLEVMARRQNLGLKTLMDVAQLRTKASAYHLGFVLGPRINAGGRIGASRLGVDLLMTECPVQALEISRLLDRLNLERQDIEKGIEQEAMDQAEAQDGARVLLTSGAGWHQGVIGIVASRLKDRFFKPSFVIAWEGDAPDALGKGSARSIPGIDLGSLIHEACHQGLLLGGGGHPMAGGLTLRRDQEAPFRVFLEDRVRALCPEPPVPELRLTAPLTAKALTDDLIHQLEALAPFGMGNPQAVAVFHDVRLVSLFPVGEGHLRAVFSQMDGAPLEAMAFRVVGKPLGDFLSSRPPTSFSIAGSIQKSTYNGKIQVILEDILLASGPRSK